MVDAHQVALEERHAKLENLIAQENSRPHPDDQQIAQWKKEKLRLRDQLAHHFH